MFTDARESPFCFSVLIVCLPLIDPTDSFMSLLNCSLFYFSNFLSHPPHPPTAHWPIFCVPGKNSREVEGGGFERESQPETLLGQFQKFWLTCLRMVDILLQETWELRSEDFVAVFSD